MTDNWPALPDGVTGVQIRHSATYEPPMTIRPTRLGDAEPKVIVAETQSYVIYRTWSADRTRDFGEHCMTRGDFEQTFERKPETTAYANLVDALNRLTRETGAEALSINFSRGDVPIDWKADTSQWEYLGGGN